MYASKILFAVLVGLVAVAVGAPNVAAHNPAKYTGIPFVVPISCQNLDSSVNAQFVNSGGATKVQVIANDSEESGLYVFCSVPGTPGRTQSSILKAVPFALGTLTVNISGIPTGGSVTGQVEYSDHSMSTATTTSNGSFTVPATSPTTPGSGVTVIILEPETGTAGTYATLYFSNFVYNNAPLLLDTSLTLTACEG